MVNLSRLGAAQCAAKCRPHLQARTRSQVRRHCVQTPRADSAVEQTEDAEVQRPREQRHQVGRVLPKVLIALIHIAYMSEARLRFVSRDARLVSVAPDVATNSMSSSIETDQGVPYSEAPPNTDRTTSRPRRASPCRLLCSPSNSCIRKVVSGARTGCRMELLGCYIGRLLTRPAQVHVEHGNSEQPMAASSPPKGG